MDPRNFYFIDNALRKGNFDDLSKYISSPVDLQAKGKTMDNQEMTVVQMVQRDKPLFLPALKALMEMGFSPSNPEVDRTGLFRIANILYHTRHNDLSEQEICQLLDQVLALAPAADLCNLHGTHPIRVVLGQRNWGRELTAWVLKHTPDLQVLDAELPLLYSMGYDNSMNYFLHAKMLMEAGANANFQVKEEHLDSNALFWLLQSIPIPIPLLYLFLENGARNPNFLFELIGNRKKKFQPHIAPVAAAYLRNEDNRPHLHLKDSFGYTPLHLAVMKQDLFLIAELVAAGAAPDLPVGKARTLFKVKAVRGDTPLSLAEKIGNPSLVQALQGQYQIPAPHIADLKDSLAAPGNLRNRFDRFVQFMESRPGMTWISKPSMKHEGMDETSFRIIDQAWPKRSDAHLALLKIGWFWGGMNCTWRIEDDFGSGFRIADWSEMITQNILCFHEDRGRTYFKVTKKGIQLRFQGTYENYQFFTLKLDLESFLERLFQVGGLSYWPYFFFPKPKAYIEKIPFFKEELERLEPEGDVSVFLS